MRRWFSYLIGLAVLLVLALVDQVVFTEEGNLGKLVGRIEVGSRDVFAQCVTMKTAYHQLRQSRNADFSASYG